LDAIFDQLRLRKIIKIVATRCQILRLECTKFDFGWGYSAPPDPLAGFKGPTSKGGQGRGEEKGGEGREGKGREGKEGKGREGTSFPPLPSPPLSPAQGKGGKGKEERGGKGGEGSGNEPPPPKSWIRPCTLSSSITPSLFHSRLKTYLFNKSFPPYISFTYWTASR